MFHKRLNKFIKNPKKALFTLAVPTIVAMTVQTMYNVVDTAFIGRLGVDAIAALTFCFPIFFILIAINQGIGVGMSAKVSQFFGAKNKTAAENAAIHGLIVSVILALVVFVLGILFLKPLFSLIGASGPVLEMSLSYMYIVLFGVFFMFPAFIFNGIFTSQGDTRTPTKIQIYALVINIILDPIFIYVFGFGIAGAAIATSISFLFSLLQSIYFIRKKSLLHIHPKNFHFSPWIIKQIIFIGAPASVLMLLISFYVTVMNNVLINFGTAYVAALGLAFRISNILFMPVIGGSVALLTLVGMFYGAKRYDLVKGIIYYSLKVGFAFTVLGGIVFFIFPSLVLRIFTADAELLRLSSSYLRIDLCTLPFLAVANLINRSMQGLGTGMPGLVVNIVRVLVVAIPLTYLFVFVFGLSYLFVAVADVIGGLVAAIVAVIWIIIKLKKLHLIGEEIKK